MTELFRLSHNDILGCKAVVHVHGYRSPSNLLGQSQYTRPRGLPWIVIDIGKKFSAGFTFVACSRVHRLSDIMFDPPFVYQHVTSLSKSMWLTERKVDDVRLCSMEHTSFPSLASLACHA